MVLAVSNCPNGAVKDIQATSNGLIVTTAFENIPKRPNELFGLIRLQSEKNVEKKSTVCLKAIDDSNLSSIELCFQISIESTTSGVSLNRKKRDTTVLISQSEPLCSYSSFAIIFVYYWCMFIGMHILTLAFLVSYMLRNYYKFFESKAFFNHLNTLSNGNVSTLTTGSSNMNKVFSNNYDPNYGFDNRNGQNGLQPNNQPDTKKNSLIFHLPKREIF